MSTVAISKAYSHPKRPLRVVQVRDFDEDDFIRYSFFLKRSGTEKGPEMSVAL